MAENHVYHEPDIVFIQAGDPETWNEQYTILRTPILGKLRRIVRPFEEAEDIYNEAFIKGYRFADRYGNPDGRNRFKSWMYRVAVNVARSHIRRASYGNEFELFDTYQEEESRRAMDVIELDASRQQLYEAIEAIVPNPDNRTMLYSRFIAGRSNRETAELMQIDPDPKKGEQIVKHRIHRMLASLRESSDVQSLYYTR
jgi:RNA polymerase sigma factor (sigma-70 family)